MFRILSLFVCLLVLANPEASYASGFWYGFKKHWLGFFANQNGIVISLVAFGALCLFIVTRGKWNK